MFLKKNTLNKLEYFCQDVFMNLHKEHGKPLVQRVLDQLVAENKLKEKINGKQKCYVANQVRGKNLSSWLGSRL